VIDERGTRHTLGKHLGGGGQGDVYATKEGGVAVKLVRTEGTMDPAILRRRLERIRRLDLGDLPLARPETVLRAPHLGYTMRLLPDAVPLGELISPSVPMESPNAWFVKTGGLRGRLRILAHLARVLHQLHSCGLAYCDLSAGNVLFSGDPLSDFSLHLIDCDNLRSESSAEPGRLHTPGYAAPELLAGRSGANTLTDLHAYAVLAHECLTGLHPFVGDCVAEGEPELEERAFAGELPWIEDPQDDSNRCTRGVPRERVLSTDTRALFARAFGPGRTDPGARPRLVEWFSVLERASDMTLHCPHPTCRATYFAAQNQPSCPWCDHALPENLTLSWLIWEPFAKPHKRFGKLLLNPEGNKPEANSWLRLTGNVATTIETRHLSDTARSPREAYRPLVSLLLRKNTTGNLICEVTNMGDQTLRLVRRGDPSDKPPPDKIIQPRKPTPIRIDNVVSSVGKNADLSRAYLHLGPDDKLHRVIRFGAKP